MTRVSRSNRITCIFCGEEKQGSDEHVIPRWVRERLNITTPVTIHVEPSGEEHQDPYLTVLLRHHVCRDCNSGWMSDLEDKVAPFLGPMLVHERSVDLDTEQQRDLARWAVMKVLLLELALRQQQPRRRPGHRYPPSEPELAWLYGRADPPPRCRVWLGAFDGQNTLTTTTQAKLFRVPMPDGGGSLQAHLTTWTIGQVLFQVFSIDFVAADGAGVEAFDGNPPAPFNLALKRIWPIEQAIVHWPSNYYVTKEILDRVVMWALHVPGIGAAVGAVDEEDGSPASEEVD